MCSLFRGIWGFRKEDRKRDTKSTPGFEKLSTALDNDWILTFRSGDLNPRFSVIFPPMI